MIEGYIGPIAIIVVLLVAIGLGLTIYEVRSNVYPDKKPRGKQNIAKRLDD